MNYYFKLSESSDGDVIETDDYLEHAASKNPDNQLYVFDRVWKDSEGHWRVDLKNTVTGATATRIGIDPKYEGKPLSFNAVKSVVRYALNNHKIAIKDSEVDKIVYTFMRLAPQFFTETGRSNYTINRGDSKNPKKSASTLPPQYLKHSVTIDSSMCAVVPTGEELSHHGILGQKWGVRRFQNKDGSLTEEGKKHYGVKSINDIDILKKGTELSTVRGITAREFLYNNGKNFTSSQLIKLKNQQANNYGFKSMPLYTYETNNEHDEKVYKGPFSIFLQMRGQRFIQEYKFKVVDDLAMPKKEDRINEFKKLTTDKKFSSDTMKLLKDMQDRCIEKNIGGEKMVKDFKALDLNNIKTDKDWDTAYKLFNHAMEAALYYNSTKEYLRRMSSKYDAMVDDNNKDIYNNAQNPIIVFNAAKVLSDNGVKNVTMEEIDKYTEELRKEQGGKVLI